MLFLPREQPGLAVRPLTPPQSPFPSCPGSGLRARRGQLPPAPQAGPSPHPRLPRPHRPCPRWGRSGLPRPALTAGAAPRGSRGPARPPPAPCWERGGSGQSPQGVGRGGGSASRGGNRARLWGRAGRAGKWLSGRGWVTPGHGADRAERINFV